MNINNREQSAVVHCDVKNCVYHDKNGTCEAKKVTVGPTFAVSASDTICATFKAKK